MIGRTALNRVRKACLGATALTGFTLITLPGLPVDTKNASPPAQVVDTPNVTGIGQMVSDEKNGFMGFCRAPLINPRPVIFASPGVNKIRGGNVFQRATAYGSAH